MKLYEAQWWEIKEIGTIELNWTFIEPMKDQYRLMKLQNLYASYWYNTQWMTESEIWEIAYKRADDFIKQLWR